MPGIIFFAALKRDVGNLKAQLSTGISTSTVVGARQQLHMTLDQEYTKLVSRRDELQKQEVTLRREFTTLVRKIASITAVLETIESPQVIERNLPSDEVLQKAPGLQPLIEMLVTLDETPLAEIEIPEKLMHSYELFRNTPLLYKDNPGHL